jgi:hypothetical protein
VPHSPIRTRNMLRQRGSSAKSKKTEDHDQENQERVSLGLVSEPVGGASYLRYEIVEKKGTKILVPVRYSIRNQSLDTTFHTKEAMEAMYMPCEMESMYAMDETAQQTAMLLRSKLAPKLMPNDFDTIYKEYEHFVLVTLNKTGMTKFEGAKQVAVATKSLSCYGSARQSQIVRDLLHRLKKESQREKRAQMPLMFTESSLPARHLIKRLLQADK